MSIIQIHIHIEKWNENFIVVKLCDVHEACYLGDNRFVFEDLLTSVIDLMIANWVYLWHVSGQSKQIFVTIKSWIDAGKSSNTMQLSLF